MNTILLAISGSVFVNALIWLLIGCLVLAFVWWALGKIGLPEQFKNWALIVLGLIALLFVINLLLSITGSPFIKF